MSSATSDPNLDEVRSRGQDSPGERQKNRAEHGRGGAGGLPRRVRNVRPLPVTPPPQVVDRDTSPADEPKPPARKTGLDVTVRARGPASMLRRPSRVRGMGTVVTLIVGMILLIVLAVALIFALDSEPAPAGDSGGASSSVPGEVRGTQGNSSAGNSNAAPASDVDPDANDASQGGDVPFARSENPRLNSPTGDAGQAETPPDSAALAALPTSHIMDDGEARLTGAWNVADRNREEYAGARYHGEGFRIDSGTFGERATAQYIFPPLRPGTYRVWISYPSSSNRASNVLVMVMDADGKHEVEVDQTVPPERGKFLEIGDFRVDALQSLVVRFDNEGVFGYLAIDAVKAESLDHPAGDGEAAHD